MPTLKSSHANKADNHGLTDMATLQRMWERACPAKRRVGGARSAQHCKNQGKHLVAITRPSANQGNKIVDPTVRRADSSLWALAASLSG